MKTFVSGLKRWSFAENEAAIPYENFGDEFEGKETWNDRVRIRVRCGLFRLEDAEGSRNGEVENCCSLFEQGPIDTAQFVPMRVLCEVAVSQAVKANLVRGYAMVGGGRRTKGRSLRARSKVANELLRQ